MNAVDLFKEYLLETGNSDENVNKDEFLLSCIKDIIIFDRDIDEEVGESRWWTDIVCTRLLTIDSKRYEFTVPYAKATGDNTVEDMGYSIDLLKSLEVRVPVTYFKVNHDGIYLHEILNITKREEVGIMLDKDHLLHNKLILVTFLTSEDRGAVSLAMVAITQKSTPTHLKTSTVIEAIMNCPDDVITTLVHLFGIGGFFTSVSAKAQIHLMIETDDDLSPLQGRKREEV